MILYISLLLYVGESGEHVPTYFSDFSCDCFIFS